MKEILENNEEINTNSLNKSLMDVFNNDEKIKELEQKLKESENKYMYLAADLENIKRRYNKQIEEFHKYEGENIFKELITFVDYLDYKIDNDIHDIDRTINIKNEILKILNKFNVKPIYDNDRPVTFNDEYDEAVSAVNTDDKILDNSIFKVYHKGYIFKDKILRHEEVIVYKYMYEE